MRKSRIASLAAVAVAGLMGVSACGSSSSSTADAEKNLAFSQLPPCPLDALEKAKKPVEITMWTDAQVSSLETMKSLADKFNKSQSDAKITIVQPFGPQTSSGSLHSAYVQLSGTASIEDASSAVDIPAGIELPALVQLDSYRVREMADAGAVLPAQSCINASGFDASKISPVAQAYYSIGGVQWPAYMVPSMLMMQYNADQFRKAGLDPAKPPKTLEELEAAARKLKASGVEHPIAMPNDPNLIESWLTGAGATLVSDGNGRQGPPQRATFFTQAAVDLFTVLQRMLKEGLINLTDNAQGQIDHLLALATGASTITFEPSSTTTSIAAVVGGDQEATQQAQQVQGGSGLGGVATKDYRAAPLPGLKQAGQASVGGSAWYISSKVPAEQQAAAWKFAEFVFQPDNQLEMLTGFGALPVTTDVASGKRVASFFAKGGLAGQWLSVASKQFQNADPALPGPLIGPYEDFFAIMRDAMVQLQTNPSASPSQILTNAENKFTQELVAYNTGGS